MSGNWLYSHPVDLTSGRIVSFLRDTTLDRILNAAKRKAAKEYPTGTSLVIVFHDDFSFRRSIDDADLDAFVRQHILNLDLRFSALYLVGRLEKVFREFSYRNRA